MLGDGILTKIGGTWFENLEKRGRENKMKRGKKREMEKIGNRLSKLGKKNR